MESTMAGDSFDAGLIRDVKQQEEIEPTTPLDDWSKGSG
jgi:hypothetical protein